MNSSWMSYLHSDVMSPFSPNLCPDNFSETVQGALLIFAGVFLNYCNEPIGSYVYWQVCPSIFISMILYLTYSSIPGGYSFYFGYKI